MIEELRDIAAKLRDGTTSFAQLEPEERQLLKRVLRADKGVGFDQQQAEFLRNWYIQVTPAQLTAANNLLSPKRVSLLARETLAGQLVVRADLITDCLDEGDTYFALRGFVLNARPIRLMPSDFPGGSDGDSA